MKYERTIDVRENTTEVTSPLVRVKLSLDRNEIKKLYNEHLETIKRKRKFNGFRTGKVPNYVVEQRFGQGAINAVITNLVHDSIRTVAKEHGDTILMKPFFSIDSEKANPEEDLMVDAAYLRKVDGLTTEGVTAVGPTGEPGLKGDEGESRSAAPAFLKSDKLSEAPQIHMTLPRQFGKSFAITHDEPAYIPDIPSENNSTSLE